MNIDQETGELIPYADGDLAAMLLPGTTQDYYYSFTRGGKLIEGLTLEGINECANRMNLEIRDVKHKDNENSWFAVAEAYCPHRNTSRWGAFEQPKMMSGRADPHAFTKAIHKAQRNALSQLIPLNLKKAMMLKAQGKHVPDSLYAESKEYNPKDAAFAAAGDLFKLLYNITPDDFWGFVKDSYKVESRNDLTNEQWTEITAKINSAKRNNQMGEALVNKINEWKKQQNGNQQNSS